MKIFWSIIAVFVIITGVVVLPRDGDQKDGNDDADMVASANDAGMGRPRRPARSRETDAANAEDAANTEDAPPVDGDEDHAPTQHEPGDVEQPANDAAPPESSDSSAANDETTSNEATTTETVIDATGSDSAGSDDAGSHNAGDPVSNDPPVEPESAADEPDDNTTGDDTTAENTTEHTTADDEPPPTDDAADTNIEADAAGDNSSGYDSDSETDNANDSPPAEQNEPAPAPAPVIVHREDGSMLIDDRFEVRGDGSKEHPYEIGWDLLISASETYAPSRGKKQIPGRVAMLHEKYVTIHGYVAFPIASQNPKEMLSMLNQWDGCCIGVPPTPYDALEVTLRNAIPGAKRQSVNYGGVTGVLKVDPYLVENWLIGLYLLDDAEVDLEL